jgi:hypothetical protein
MRATLFCRSPGLDAIDARLGAIDESLADRGRLLEEMVGRLPAE